MHVHDRTEEGFYVLRGQLALLIDDEDVLALCHGADGALGEVTADPYRARSPSAVDRAAAISKFDRNVGMGLEVCGGDVDYVLAARWPEL